LKSLDLWINALGDSDWRVRRRAVEHLLRDSGENSLEAFIRKVRVEHRDASVLNSVLQVLVSIGSEALPALVTLTRDADAEVRMYAALALGDLGNHWAIPAISALLSDQDINVRYHAIEALAKLKATEAVDQLAAIAESQEFFLAFPALEALAAIGEPRVSSRLVPLLQNETLQSATIEALGQLGDETLIQPLSALMDRGDLITSIVTAIANIHDRYDAVYNEGEHIADLVGRHVSAEGARNMISALNVVTGDTLRALVRVLGWVEGETAVADLTRLLGSAEIRTEVVETFVRYGDKVTGILCEQLNSDDLNTRQAAVTALARIGDPGSVPSLLKALADPELTVEAAAALAKIGDRQAYEPLIQLLGHDRAAVRQAAIAAINSLGDPRTPKDIKKLIFNSNPHVRESAVRIAGYFGYPESAGDLLDRIHDISENVRRAAVENLAHLQDDRAFDALSRAAHDESSKIRSAAVRSLGYVENVNVLPELLRALMDEDAWVRYYAARSLGQLRLPGAIDALSTAVRQDRANQVRIAAADALGSIGGPRVVSVLAPLAEAGDRDLARAVLHALGTVGHPDALHPILALLRAADPSRRLDAISALAARRDRDAVEALRSTAANDTEPQIVTAAISQLAAMATTTAIAALLDLTATRTLRDQAIGALCGMDTSHIDRIATGLESSETEVRRATVEVLSRMKHPSASEFLGKALEDEDPQIRLAAILALKRLGNHMLDKHLAYMVRSDPDKSVRDAAGKALER
jgi:HEAT repeat protein